MVYIYIFIRKIEIVNNRTFHSLIHYVFISPSLLY